jgi:hypothetical protein
MAKSASSEMGTSLDGADGSSAGIVRQTVDVSISNGVAGSRGLDGADGSSAGIARQTVDVSISNGIAGSRGRIATLTVDAWN